MWSPHVSSLLLWGVSDVFEGLADTLRNSCGQLGGMQRRLVCKDGTRRTKAFLDPRFFPRYIGTYLGGRPLVSCCDTSHCCLRTVASGIIFRQLVSGVLGTSSPPPRARFERASYRRTSARLGVGPKHANCKIAFSLGSKFTKSPKHLCCPRIIRERERDSKDAELQKPTSASGKRRRSCLCV